MSANSNNKFCYFVLNIKVPISPTTIIPFETDSNIIENEINYKDHLGVAIDACKLLGVKLQVIETRENESDTGNRRYVLRHPYYKKDNGIILKLIEALIFCLSLNGPPVFGSKEPDLYYEFPPNIIQKGKYIIKNQLVEFEESKPYPERTVDFPYSRFFSIDGWGGVSTYINSWKFVPIVFSNPNLLNAARFFTISQNNFYVFPGQREDVILGLEIVSNNLIEQNTFESALLNSFKAIEAVLGILPKKNKKLFIKLDNIGVDFQKEIGYPPYEPMYKLLRKMEYYRNIKSAHGNSTERELTVLELMNFQLCARLIIYSAIEIKTDEYWEPNYFEDRFDGLF